MKFSDKKQLVKAKERFEESMYLYNKVLIEMPNIELTVDDYNQLARQMMKLTKTLVRIKERSEESGKNSRNQCRKN